MNIISKLLLIFTLLNTQTIFCQSEFPEKKDNIIIIKTDSTVKYNFESFGQHLVDNGYTLAIIDKTFNTITTAEKSSKANGGYQHKLKVSFKDSFIIIRATCNLLMLGSSIGNYIITWTDWEYAKAKSNLFNMHYRAFIPVLTSYKSKSLLYYRK